MSFPGSLGVMNPCPLSRQNVLHVPVCTGDSDAILDLKKEQAWRKYSIFVSTFKAKEDCAIALESY